MNSIIIPVISILVISALPVYSGQVSTPDAREIVKRADESMRGKTSEEEITMSIIRPGWTRTLSLKTWSKGLDFSLVQITSPAKEKGQVFLKRKTEMWNWVPAISRLIKVPPSMMNQSWMGSDFTNDDLVKEASLVRDYKQTITGSDTIGGHDCYKIELTPLPEAPVVWGKVLIWISKRDFIELRIDRYDEDGNQVNVMTLSSIKQIGTRFVPMKMEVRPADKPEQKTVIDISAITFDKPISEDFFSQQTMQRLR